MKLDKKFFNKLKKQIERDWGKKCWGVHTKGLSPLCGVCMIWLAYEMMRDLYQIDYKKLKPK